VVTPSNELVLSLLPHLNPLYLITSGDVNLRFVTLESTSPAILQRRVPAPTGLVHTIYTATPSAS